MNILPTIFLIGMAISLYFAFRPLTGYTKWHGLAGAAVCFVLVGVTAPEPDSPPVQQAATDRTTKSGTATDQNGSGSSYGNELKQYSWIRVSKDALKEKLKDPSSAQFRNVRFYSGGGPPVVCGEVNARNSFGGYGGFERFIAAGSTMAFLESEVSDGLDEVWKRMCVKAPSDRAYER